MPHRSIRESVRAAPLRDYSLELSDFPQVASVIASFPGAARLARSLLMHRS